MNIYQRHAWQMADDIFNFFASRLGSGDMSCYRVP